MSDTGHKKITVGLICGWIFGTFFLLAGVTYLFSQPLPGLIFLLASAVSLPPLYRFVAEKTKMHLSGGVKFLLIVVLLAGVGTTIDTSKIGTGVPGTSSAPTTSGSKPTPAPKQEEAKLELQSMRVYKEYSFAHIDGMVKNISGEKMENVMAVGEFYDANDNFIKSAEALIEYNPILPGQSSPFSVLTTDNPEIKNGKIVFKAFWGGTISTKDARE